jgi:hypothetical protein
LPIYLNERTTSTAYGQGTATRTSLLALLREIVGKSKRRSCNEGVIDYARTSAVLTSMTTTETLLLSKALGRIGRSYRKKSIVNGAYSSALGKLMLAVTATARASASAGGGRLSLC